MYTRILVPLDGSALAEAIMKPALEYSFSDPSIASRLVDGLEAEAQPYSNASTDGVQCGGIQTFSLQISNSRSYSDGRRRDKSRYIRNLHSRASG